MLQSSKSRWWLALLGGALLAALVGLLLSDRDDGEDVGDSGREVAALPSGAELPAESDLDRAPPDGDPPRALVELPPPEASRAAEAGARAAPEHAPQWVDFEVRRPDGQAAVGAALSAWSHFSQPLPRQPTAHSVEPPRIGEHARSTLAPRDGSSERPPDTRATTDAAGRCRMLLAGGPWLYSAELPDVGWSGYRTIDVGHQPDAPIVVELAAPRHLDGRVLDAHGQPAPGATIRFSHEGYTYAEPIVDEEMRWTRDPPELLTDAEGRFCVELDDGYFFGLVWAESGPRRSGPAAFFGQDQIELVIGTGFSITGFVRTDAGRPLTDALVRAVRPDTVPFGSPDQVGTRDEPPGWFSLHVDDPGTYVVFADDRRGQLTTCEPPRVVVGEGRAQAVVDLRLCPMTEIAGRVRDVTGAPIEGLDLSAWVTSPRFMNYMRVNSSEAWTDATTDAEGRFTLAGLHPAVAYNLVSHDLAPEGEPRHQSILATDVPAGTRDLELSIDREAHRAWTLHGIVVKASSGNPMLEYGLSLEWSLPALETPWYLEVDSEEEQVERASGGRFILSRLKPGTPYRIVVKLGAVEMERFPIERRASSLADPAVFVVGSRGGLHVRALDDQERPAAGAALELVPEAGLASAFRSTDGRYSAACDGEGRGVFSEVRADTYLLLANGPEGRGSALSRVTIGHGASVETTIRLTRGGAARVRLEATDPAAKPLGEAGVSIRRLGLPSGTSVAAGKTDGSGVYTSSPLEPGVHWVICSSAAYGGLDPEPAVVAIWGDETIDVRCRAGF